jgi:hypothetical protein
MKAAFPIVLVLASVAWAEPNQLIVTQFARFQIIQSMLIPGKQTFKLDEATGHVWQMVQDANGDEVWEKVPVVGLPDIAVVGVPPLNRPLGRFDIFCSGNAARWCFLLDSVTGQTWQIVATKDGDQEFDPMPDVP